MKICKLCRQEKDESAFSDQITGKGGKRSQCNECRALYESKGKKAAVMVVEAPHATFAGLNQEERLKLAVELRMEYYKKGAIEAIFDIAMMPVSTNPLQNQTKLIAAQKLAGPLPGDSKGDLANPAADAYDNILKKLSEDYRKSAPRISSMRERVVTFDEKPADNDLT